MLELGLLDYLKQFLYPSIKVSLFSFSFSFLCVEGHVPPHIRQLGRRLTTTHNIVMPGVSFTCQAVNLSEIESENNARKI